MAKVQPVIHLYQNDLPESVKLGDVIAIDTETMGLEPKRDRLCLVQLCDGSEHVHLVKFDMNSDYTAARNLIRLLEDDSKLKVFHFARFDLAALYFNLQVMVRPVYCTKIVSRLVRTYADRHGLKDLCRELINIDLSKQEQMSDWGSDELSPEQMRYAANDVLYLHALKEKLDHMLIREGRVHLAQACFDFLPHRAILDLLNFADPDILNH